MVAEAVAQLDVRPGEWVAAEAHGDDLVDLGCSGVVWWERLVDWLAAEGAGVVGGEDSSAELCAAVAVRSARVAWHR